MKIKDNLYESLTMRQRIALALEAAVRGDEQERKKLVQTCPKKIYRMNDGVFTDAIDLFFDISLIVACDIRENLLLYAIAREQEMGEGSIFLQRVSNIKEAWKQFVLGYGVQESSLQELPPPESCYMFLVEGRLPMPQSKEVDRIYNDWKALLNG